MLLKLLQSEKIQDKNFPVSKEQTKWQPKSQNLKFPYIDKAFEEYKESLRKEKHLKFLPTKLRA